MKKNAHPMLRYAAWFLALIALFTLAMTLVYCIPTNWIAYRHETSSYILDMEEEKGVWFGNFFGVEAGRLDNTTDSLMIDELMQVEPGQSALEAAMSVGGYSRYWHGYHVFLRPLSVFFDYWQIRYINMFAFFLLVGAVMLMISKKLRGEGRAIAFLASLIACYIVVVPVSLQYHSVFLIFLSASFVLLARYEQLTKRSIPLFFMVVGMVTNFLDFLTAPLLTLGMPLLLLLELDMHSRDRVTVVLLLRRIIVCSIAWWMGYALCWVSKWCIGSLVLGESVFLSAEGAATMWLGNAWGTYGRLIACAKNFEYFFLAHGKRVYFPLIIPAVAYAICALRFPNKDWKRALVLLPIGLYPYVWYVTLANHSLFHTWFTNRLQAMTLFAVLLFLIELVDWQRLKDAMSWMKKDENTH